MTARCQQLLSSRRFPPETDLEFALARAVGAIGDTTPVVTTVHDLQGLAEDVPMTPHDVPLDVIVTPTRVIRTRRAFPRPAGIHWTSCRPSSSGRCLHWPGCREHADPP